MFSMRFAVCRLPSHLKDLFECLILLLIAEMNAGILGSEHARNDKAAEPS